MKNKNIKAVVYSFVVADLFHYGHLQLLKTAKSLGDYHICGVLTDEAAETYRTRPIANLDERIAVLSDIKSIDRVMIQEHKDPTENLKRIHAEFKDAELILVHGNDWHSIPGKDFVEQINGRVVQPEYYRRLSDIHIRKEVSKQFRVGHPYNYELFTEQFKIDNIVYFEKEEKRFVLSSKANTLRSLQSLLTKSKIEKMIVFRVHDWDENPNKIIKRIKQIFAPDTIIVRSSAINEDTFYSSSAGCFRSEMNISSTDDTEVKTSIERVIESYRENGGTYRLDQLLVQKQTKDVSVSGVVFTNNIETGAPYYIINYDDTTGNTETVTSGRSNSVVKIYKHGNWKQYGRRWRKLLDAVNELERIIPDTALDIEFAINTQEEVIIFQVRPLVVHYSPKPKTTKQIRKYFEKIQSTYQKLSHRPPHLAGEKTIFSDMAYWNPAEIIGDRPNTLDYSLYRYIITDSVWHEALTPLGYTDVFPAKLMINFAGKPYIDVRNAFNALIPKPVPKELRKKLLVFYLDKLRQNPEFHDKVEFEIIDNCFDFCLPDRLQSMLSNGFSQEETDTIKKAFVDLTNFVLIHSKEIIKSDLASVRTMGNKREHLTESLKASNLAPQELISKAMLLLNDCKQYGTLPFSRLARMAFIGNELLISMVKKIYISPNEYDQFMDSIQSVASQLRKDHALMNTGEMRKKAFFSKYGHLRPGTYNINSPRYDRNPELFSSTTFQNSRVEDKTENFIVDDSIHARINEELHINGIQYESSELFHFIIKITEAREYVKFEFTKNLSDALELIALCGKKIGFSRMKMSMLPLRAIQNIGRFKTTENIQQYWQKIIECTTTQKNIFDCIALPPIIFSRMDFEIIEYPKSKPNFITQKEVIGELVNLDLCKNPHQNIENKIILIEKADPGYDWIFTKNIGGLITKYGGVASHMAIRCAEFGMPAAIGCGDAIVKSLLKAQKVILNCREKTIRTIY